VKLFRAAVVPLRIVLVLTFALLVMAEVFSFPGMFAYRAKESPDFESLRWPLLAVVELGMLCVQVVIVCTWRLVTLTLRDSVFSPASFKWVDAILAAIGVAWLLLLGLSIAVAVTADDPGDVVAMALLFLPASAFALVMVVMRTLLLRATSLSADLEGVI
jgi:hypothetical protein